MCTTYSLACTCVYSRIAVEVGDDVVVPEVAACLGDPELSDLAYEAMWSMFMKQ
jgi:hypothetical protein